MSKQSGLGDGLVLDGVDLSGDTGGIGQLGSSRPTQNVPGIDVFAQERLQLRRDGRIEWASYFNPSSGRSHEELSTLPIADRIVTYLRGRSLGGPSMSMVAKQVNYDATRNADGSIGFALSGQANGFGAEWGNQLTVGFDDFAGADSGAGVDFGASTAFGIQAYLQLIAFTGTDITVAVQESADDGAGDAYTDVVDGTFPALSAVGAARIQTARDQTVEQWLRVNVTGTFTAATLAVMVKKNDHEVILP